MPVAVADVVAVCVSRGDKLSGLFELCRYTERRGEVIGRAHRQIAYRNRHPRAHQPVYSFVERAVSAAADNKVMLPGEIACYVYGVALTGGVFDGKVKYAVGKSVHYLAEICSCPVLSRAGIDNKKCFFLLLSVVLFISCKASQ